MLLAHAIIKVGEQIGTELCLIPEESDPYSYSFPVKLLKPTEDAVFRIGPKESITIVSGDEPNSIVINPVPPAPLYLTPECPMQPGFRVVKVKLVLTASGYKTFYVPKGAVGDLWKEWIANKEKV